MVKGSFNPCDGNGQMLMVVVIGWGRVVEVRKVGTGEVRRISLWTITKHRVVICTVDTLKLV
jgi:hypothetical protein